MKAIAVLTLSLLWLNLLVACAPSEPVSGPTVGTSPTIVASPAPGEVRPAAVAGGFYPRDPQALAKMVDEMLAEVERAGDLPRLPAPPMALIVPHAGYVFSGQVAAYAFHQIRGVVYEAVVVVGTNHVDPNFRKVSVYAKGAFQTPLGLVPVDEELAAQLLAADPQHLVFERGVHRDEHSIEVELPFLQRLLPGCKIVPIIVGEPSPENTHALSDVLVKVLAGKRALLIASSDLSHYPSYDDARQVDAATLGAILTMNPERFRRTIQEQERRDLRNLATCACGEGPILTAMMAARGLGANQAALLKYANSGDTPFGDRDQVVGYGAVAFWQGSPLPSTPAVPSSTSSGLCLGMGFATKGECPRDPKERERIGGILLGTATFQDNC